jgi:hypothetical protein
MTISGRWTPVDETILFYARALENELRVTHGVLFAAAFLDEFEIEIRNVAIHSIISKYVGEGYRPGKS